MMASQRQPFYYTSLRCQSSTAAATPDIVAADELSSTPLPSPLPENSQQSAKLAALHSRLSLSNKIPLHTLARSLVTRSADSNANFNNSNQETLGRAILDFQVLEYITCKWPRLPTPVLRATQAAYAGNEALEQVAKRWGVEAAAAPGQEVDPGLLQWTINEQDLAAVRHQMHARSAANRGGDRVGLGDGFADVLDQTLNTTGIEHAAYASFVRAVIGSIYVHSGREAAKSFVNSHILSRQFEPSVLFEFRLPTKELAMLCAREGFAAPVARLESETGRLSRTPVYVVGIYSDLEKLGEGNGPSLDIARRKASMNALKAWYLYSPGNKVRVPSDMLEQGAKPWKTPHIDIGEIV